MAAFERSGCRLSALRPCSDTERSNMTIEILAPPDARPPRPRALRKGWAEEMLARCASKPDVVEPNVVEPMRAPAMARRPASRRRPEIAIDASTRAGRRAVLLTLPKPRAD
jgi:hypothetical protein